MIALGLVLAQPAIAPGELFRVGQVEVTTRDSRDAHTRADPGDEPSLPAPDGVMRWSIDLWTACDRHGDRAVIALARGDPPGANLDALEAAFRAGMLFRPKQSA